jgi:hypothetical protein
MAAITNLSRYLASANGAALTSGVMTAVSVKVNAGVTIRNVSFCTGTTAAGTPTHWGFAVYSTAAVPALLGVTLDQTTTAMPANTVLTKNLVTPVAAPKAGSMWVAIWVAATTVPTLLSAPVYTAGLLNTIALVPGEVDLAVTSGAGLTTAPPATIVTGGVLSLTVPWVGINLV